VLRLHRRPDRGVRAIALQEVDGAIERLDRPVGQAGPGRRTDLLADRARPVTARPWRGRRGGRGSPVPAGRNPSPTLPSRRGSPGVAGRATPIRRAHGPRTVPGNGEGAPDVRGSFVRRCLGSDLLSHPVTRAVPSALDGLT